MTITNGNVANAIEVLGAIGRPSSQLAYEQVKADSSSWTNTDYLGADIFTSANGAKSTVDTTASTGIWASNTTYYTLSMTDEASGDTTHDPTPVTNPENAFDGNDATYADKTSSNNQDLGKTFASKYVGQVRVKASFSGTGVTSSTIKLETYNGSTWSVIATLVSGTTSISYDDEYYLNTTTQGIRIAIDASGGTLGTYDARWYTIEYGDFDAASTVETNSIISDKVPDAVTVYAKITLPANTSATVDISDDGGSTFALTAQALNTAIDTTSFTTGNLAIKLNMASTDTSATPLLYGYGVAIHVD